MIQIPWQIHWGVQQLSGSNPALTSWSVSVWDGNFCNIDQAVRRSLLNLMLDDRMIELDAARSIQLNGWVLNVPLPEDVVQRCETWDALRNVRVFEGVSEHQLCQALGVGDTHDIVARLNPLPEYDKWFLWRQTAYKVLHHRPWA